jgi:hypothetical protein
MYARQIVYIPNRDKSTWKDRGNISGLANSPRSIEGKPHIVSREFANIARLFNWNIVPGGYLQTYIIGTVQLHRLKVILSYYGVTSEYFCKLSKNEQDHLAASFIDEFSETGLVSDHASGYTTDNTDENLRPASSSENIWNSNIKYKTKSPFRYVHQIISGDWQGCFRNHGKIFKPQQFPTAKEAAISVDPMVLNERGVYAVLNCNPDIPMGNRYEEFRVGKQSLEWWLSHNLAIPEYFYDLYSKGKNKF